MADYSSFLYAISTCLSDSSAEVKECASEALIELARASPLLITKTLVGEINGITAETACVNRTECVLTLSKIISENFRPELIDLVVPPLVSIVTFSPSLDEKLVQASIEVISSLSEHSAAEVASKFPQFSNNSSHLIKFFCERAKARDPSFFVANDRPSPVFESLMGNLGKTSDEKSRLAMCSLLSAIADVMVELYPKGSCLAPHFGNAMDMLSTTWFRTPSTEVQNAILVTIGTMAGAAEESAVASKFEKWMTFYSDALTKPSLRVAAASGFSSLVSLLEGMHDKPKVHVQSVASKLVDFVEAEYGRIQMDGAVLKGVNLGIGALVHLMSSYPRTPLDLVIRRLPSQAALYTMNYFCSALGQTEFSLDILSALANVKIQVCSADQREQYSTCFFTLMKKCVMRVPEYMEIFKNVVIFMSESGQQSRDAIMGFICVVQQNPFCYSVLFPNLFIIMMDPHFLYGVPTLATAGAILETYIARSVKQIEMAGITLPSVMSLLMIFSCCQLFTSETQEKLRVIVCRLVDAAPQSAGAMAKTIFSRMGGDFCVKLLSACQSHINTYVKYGGEKPLLAPKVQSALRAAIAVCSGYLVQLECCVGQVETVNRDVMARFIQTEHSEIEGISKYLGLVSSVKPAFAIKFVNEQLDILIANRQDKLKFWKKKAIPQMPAQSAVLSTALIMENVSSGSRELSNIFQLCVTAFLNDNSIQEQYKMALIRAGFDLSQRDNSFQIQNGKQIAQHVVQNMKNVKAIEEFAAGIGALRSILRVNPSLIDNAEAIIKSILEGTHKFKPAELVESVIPGVGDLIQTIVTVANISDPSIMLSFHEVLLPMLVMPSCTLVALVSMKQVVNSFKTLQNGMTALSMAVAYIILSNVPAYAEQATPVSERLLTLIHQAKYDFSSPKAIASQLIQFDTPDLLPTIFSAAKHFAKAPSQYSHACSVFLKAFAETNQTSAVVKALVHEYVELPLDMCEALVLLVNFDVASVTEQLLEEPVDGSVVSSLSSLFTSEQSKDLVIRQLLSCNSEKNLNCVRLLQKVRYSIPFEGNAEYVYIHIARIALENTTPEVHNLICDILLVNLANKEPFEAEGQARKDFETNTMAVIRAIFKDLLSQSTANPTELFSNAEKISKCDETCGIVAAAAAGSVIHCDISLDLSGSILELLAMPGSDAVKNECFIAIGEFADASLEVKTSKASSVVTSLIENIKKSPNPYAVASLVRIVMSLIPEQVFEMASEVLDLVQELLTNATQEVTVSALEVLTFLASSSRLTSSSEVSKKLSQILPLVVVNIQSAGLEASSKAISALCKRLGFPPLSVTETVYEFVDRNISVLKAPTVDQAAFVSQLLRCKSSKNETIRASICYLSAALLHACGDALAAEKSGIVALVSEMMSDSSSDVRLSASRSLVLLNK